MPRNEENPRLKQTTPADLRELSQRLKKASAAALGVAAAMESAGTKNIDVDGTKMLERAFDSIAAYIGNCQKKLREF